MPALLSLCGTRPAPMARCPLCKTQYPDGVSVCKIDGTRLAGDRTASVALPSLGSRSNPTEALRASDLELAIDAAAALRPAGKGRIPGGLASMTDEVTTAAKPEALAARARGYVPGDEDPPRIATGSGTVAPKSKKRDAWAKPFLDIAPATLDSQNSEAWVGKTLGSYKLISILGKGGMGCVYRAEHTKLGREVALKVLRSDYAKRKDAVARFFQEARSVNKVRHRNIVDITDLVELDSGTVFIIMEYLEGVSLTKVMRSDGPPDPVRILGLLVQICDGLAAAHSVGIVHRDLKPDNIIVCKEGDQDLVKVLDFGVAKLLDKGEDDDIGLMTVAGSVVGTPAFMSPEQAGGLQVDGRADIYSLGAIMYEMFTSQPLFRGKSFGEYVRMHLNEKPVPPSSTPGGKGINPSVEDVIMMCLEKSPDARFQTAHELRAELLSLLSTFESSGELTAHLAKHKQDAMPVGDAVPRRGEMPYPAEPNGQIGILDGAAEVPGYYQLPGDSGPGASGRPSEQILVSRSSAALPVPGFSGSGFPQHTPGPALPFANAGYASDQHMRFLGAGDTSVLAPPARNYRGVGVGVVICLAAIIALVMTMGSSGDSPAPDKELAGASAGDTTSSDTIRPAADDAPSVAPESAVSATSPSANPRIVVIDLSSDPTAEVFAVGAVSPVCKATPCDLQIDPTDGGSASRRDYILRSPGHLDSTITINLRAPREQIFVTLNPAKAVRTPAIATPLEGDDEKVVPKKTGSRTDRNPKKPGKTDKSPPKPKCNVGAQDTFNPFGEDPPCE